MDAGREAYLEQEREGWMQTELLTGNWRKKSGCRQGSILGTGKRRVDADREAYFVLEEEYFE